CSSRGIVFFLVRRAGVIEDDHPDRMAVAPEVFVVLLDGFAHVPQAVGWDDEKQVFLLHTGLRPRVRASSLCGSFPPGPFACWFKQRVCQNRAEPFPRGTCRNYRECHPGRTESSRAICNGDRADCTGRERWPDFSECNDFAEGGGEIGR